MQIETKHLEGYTFESKVRDFTILMDSSGLGTKAAGPTPKEALLAAIMNCSGMDVVGLLKKHKVDYKTYEMTANAEQTAQHPKVFIQVDLCYRFTGENLDLEKIKEAVDLSMTRYCGVSAMVSKVVPLYYVVMVNGEIEHRGEAKFF